MNSKFRYHAYKVELKPTSEQIQIIERTIGVCRYIDNLFIATNRDNYARGTAVYMSGYDFSKWLNHEYKSANPDKLWTMRKLTRRLQHEQRNFMRKIDTERRMLQRSVNVLIWTSRG